MKIFTQVKICSLKGLGILYLKEKKMDKIAVLIPCYNEEKTIKKVVEDFKRELPEAVIYVYDNNSKDKTSELAKEAGAIVRCETKQGKGNVIRTMFREIDAESYIMVDGDDTYPAENAREMVNCVLEEDIDMVIGDRLSSTYFTENKRRFHGFGNVLTRVLINTIYKSDIRDVMTGYRAFSYKFVKTFPVMSKGFELENEMTIHALDKNLKIKNLIIEYRDRPERKRIKIKHDFRRNESHENDFHTLQKLQTIGIFLDCVSDSFCHWTSFLCASRYRIIPNGGNQSAIDFSEYATFCVHTSIAIFRFDFRQYYQHI